MTSFKYYKMISLIAFLCALMTYIMFNMQIFVGNEIFPILSTLGGFTILICLCLLNHSHKRKEEELIISSSSLGLILTSLILMLVQDIDLYSIVASLLIFLFTIALCLTCLFLYTNKKEI